MADDDRDHRHFSRPRALPVSRWRLAGFGNVTLSSFVVSGSPTLPSLPAGLSWQVELTSGYVRLYVQGNLAMGSGTWTNAAGDSNWSTSTSANSNWSGGQPSSAGQIATFGTLSSGAYAGGVVNVDKSGQTIGGIVLANSGQGGYTIGTNGGTVSVASASVGSTAVTLSSRRPRAWWWGRLFLVPTSRRSTARR